LVHTSGKLVPQRPRYVPVQPKPARLAPLRFYAFGTADSPKRPAPVLRFHVRQIYAFWTFIYAKNLGVYGPFYLSTLFPGVCGGALQSSSSSCSSSSSISYRLHLACSATIHHDPPPSAMIRHINDPAVFVLCSTLNRCTLNRFASATFQIVSTSYG
jgi:hypothetical protein